MQNESELGLEENHMEIRLETINLNIIPFENAYLNDYYCEFTEEITHYQYPEPFTSKANAKKQLEDFCNLMEKGQMLELVIISKTGKFIGSLEVHGLNEDYPEIGIWIKKSEHGKGYAFEALSAIISFMNNNYNKENYTYEVDIRNVASIRLVKKFCYIEKDINKFTTESGKSLNLQTYLINNR